MGQWLAAAESESKDPNALGAAAALRLVLARELGLPLTAAAELSMIKGRLSLGATLLRARAIEYGYRVKRIDGDEKSCTAAIVEIESGEEIGRSTFTIEQAVRRNLVKDRGNWITMPERMLWARATTEALRDYAPEVVVGLAATEELDEYDVDVDESGHDSAFVKGQEPGAATRAAAAATSDLGPEGEQSEPAMSDAQRRKLFALIGDLDKRFAPPKRQDGTQAADWRTILTDSVDESYDKDVHELTKSEASEMIERVQARLLDEERKAVERGDSDQPPDDRDPDVDPEADDIPF